MDEVETKQKNYAIEWYRYFFAAFICILHIKEYAGSSYPFGGAYLAVEFFLILSGYLLMQSIERHPAEGDAETATLAFMKKRFFRFYPQYILSWALLAAYVVFVRHSISIKEVIINYWDEILMLQMLGAGKTFNAAMWYMSALFIVSGIIYYLAAKNRKFFTHIFAPCATLLIYSYFYQTRGMLAGVGWNNLLIVRDGFWRALAGISLGCIVYEVHAYTQKMTGGGDSFLCFVRCMNWGRSSCCRSCFTVRAAQQRIFSACWHDGPFSPQRHERQHVGRQLFDEVFVPIQD